MNTLVTGGGGFLGRRLSEMLLERGDLVRVLGRHAYPDLAARGVDCLQGDIRDVQSVIAACRGADVVFHVAAKAGVWGDRSEFFAINMRGTANVIRGCIENQVKALVFTSSPSVVIGSDDIAGGDESLPYPTTYLAAYPESKALAERMVLDADGWEMVPANPEAYTTAHGEDDVVRLRTCALRPHLIWGPGDPHLIPRILQAAETGALPIVGKGTNRVDITYIDNAAQAHVLAADNLLGPATCGGKAYFIGDAEPVLLWSWIHTLLTRLGRPPIRRRIPYPLAYGLATTLELLHNLHHREREPRLTRFSVRQLGHSHWFSHEAARSDFGYRPLVGPEEGLDRLVAWLHARAADNGPT